MFMMMNATEANNFVTKLKAHGTENDIHNLEKAFDEFKSFLDILPKKDKCSFASNVLCTLCRNVEKIPSWSSKVCNKDLLILSIDCVRQLRGAEGQQQVKTLACVYHMHRYIVKQNSVPPELVLKLSFMPFECEEKDLLCSYYKTYWSILADRISYIERLKTLRLPVSKLLPKFKEDVSKLISIYDPFEFCTNLLPFLVKKLYYIFGDLASMELNDTFKTIFNKISIYSNKIKTLNERDVKDVYIKFNDCIHIVTENSSKNNFSDNTMEDVVRICVSLLGHEPGIQHCLLTFYLNSFCHIFKNLSDESCLENVLNNVTISCDTTKKLGYTAALNATFPFICQMLRICFDSGQIEITDRLQGVCLNMISYFLENLHKCNQLIKCENCCVKTGLHDAIRLSFLAKNIIKTSPNIDKLPKFYDIIEKQYKMMSELKGLGCTNHEKYFQKIQTDVHNFAVSFNKLKIYEYSIKLFDIYLKYELRRSDYKNISRALYNKSICEVDNKMYRAALVDAYLSLAFAQDLTSEKYMSLVLDIKAKALKDEDAKDLQTVSVLEACEKVITEKCYGDLSPYLTKLRFSTLLQHEYSAYVKLWPSLSPICGVLTSLVNILDGEHAWIRAEEKSSIRRALSESVVSAASVVRSVHGEPRYRRSVLAVLRLLSERDLCIDDKVAQATLLLIKCELDLHEAGERHGWRQALGDQDDVMVNRTLSQEYEATRDMGRAVELVTEIVEELSGGAPGGGAPGARHLLLAGELAVHQLLLLGRTAPALQLAASCAALAALLHDREACLRVSSCVASAARGGGGEPVRALLRRAGAVCGDVFAGRGRGRGRGSGDAELEFALVFTAQLAIYYEKRGRRGVAARLLRGGQARLLAAHTPLDLAVGSVLEAQMVLCADTGLTALTAVNTLQRHYLAIKSTGTSWSVRRRNSAYLQHRTQLATAACVRVAARLHLPRRAAAAHRAAPPAALSAAARAALCAARLPHDSAHPQVKLDNCLKYIVGLNLSTDTHLTPTKLPAPHFTPQQNVENMLDVYRNTQLSPSLPTAVPPFSTPPFLRHSPPCDCFACKLPQAIIIAAKICYLQASIYFRSNELRIARNYFEGALRTFSLAETRLDSMFDEQRKCFDGFVVDVARSEALDELKTTEIEFLIEYAMLELSEKRFEEVDDRIIRIHEILSEIGSIDPYVKHEVTNLLIASSVLRKDVQKPVETDLRNELECLKLTPNEAKTPESKREIPSDATLKVVKADEIPKKRKVIKLNLDEVAEDAEKPAGKFKVPDILIPKTSRPVLENVTPRPTRSRRAAHTSHHEEFLTPQGSTPAETFLTPMTSEKTYSRRIVKKLDAEFSTPKEAGNRTLRSKSLLKRATSPGKLERSRERVQQPDFDDK